MVNLLLELLPEEAHCLPEDHARVRVPPFQVGPGLDRRQSSHALRPGSGLRFCQVRTRTRNVLRRFMGHY